MIKTIQIKQKITTARITSGNRKITVNIAKKNRISAVLIGRQGPPGESGLTADAPDFALQYEIAKL